MNICCRFYYLALILSLLVAVHKDIQMCMKTYSCKQIYSKDIHAQHTKILKHTWKDIHIWRIQRYSRIQRYWNVAFTATRRWMDNFEKWRGWFLKRGHIRQLVVFCPNFWGNYCFSSNYCGNFSFVSSVRSSYSHPDLLLTHPPHPTFSDHTGPQHWTFTFWATTAI